MEDPGVHRKDIGRVAVLTIHNPERRNAFNEAMWDSLEKAAADLRARMPRVVVITGAGESAFSAGFNVNPDNPQVSRLAEAVMKKEVEPVRQLIRRIRGAVDGLVSLPVPVIAAVNGIAYGGGAELASRCDMRIMDPEAEVCFSEVRLGLMPDWGGTAALSRIVGRAAATEMVLSAGKYSASECLRSGFANRVSAPGKCLEEALTLAEKIAANGPRAVRSALRVIRQSGDLPMDRALDLESEEAVTLIASGECYHGIAAFLAKKEPEFPD